ncbi:MAG: ankyrin repeat domain-containing protein [Chloroflexi bacterium]|nr:MAG: ankyrin repeat domain-containing protein [Chloroflexota bacterium]
MRQVTAAIDAIKRDDAEQMRALLRDDPSLAVARAADGLSVLTTAAYHSRKTIVELLLATGPLLDIFEASTVGRADRVGELLDEGVSPATVSPDGFTPLHLAAFFGHPETVRLLLDRGAEVDPVSDNDLRVRPLNSAAAGGHGKVVGLLLQHGAAVDGPEGAGFTPLHVAAENGDVESARLLLAAGANPERRTDDGRTAADMASERGHTGVLVLLRESPAEEAAGQHRETTS